ncbi:hypothetical protein [Paenibacillus sp. PAMC21692]|uniref:hypothetical protein n=1 Tax=Paenibacillus sp. PAMC21692 TaxID=2762320 RepID=UPI00164DC79D|nr:hypothetical protein [Paenibacillus sp. PAMC21692]QNK59312.1 hypothetical protein H7F31_10760 [Paenibacillus sp. PAMC21692]
MSYGTGKLERRTDGLSPLYTTEAEDGFMPTITGFSGELNGEMTLDGFFSAKNSSQSFFLKGDSGNIGIPAFGNEYKHSDVDSYGEHGACIAAPKIAGNTNIGTLASGSDSSIPLDEPTDEFFFTGMIKLVTENYGGADAQVKIFRLRNENAEALMYATPQWAGSGATRGAVQDFVWSVGFNGSSGYGTHESGAAILSGEWVRVFMYYKASSELGVFDGAQLMARKSSATNELFFQFRESDSEQSNFNDWRKKGVQTLPAIFKPAKVANIFDRATPPRSKYLADMLMPYYARANQVFECRLDCIYGNDSMESVWLANSDDINIAFATGKLELQKQISRTENRIVIDASTLGNLDISDNIYAIVVNSNRQPSTGILVRAAE